MIKNLSEVSREEQLEFLNSFDRVLTDMDGTIWLSFVPFQDSQQCLDNFRKVGKSVNFVTNLATRTLEIFSELLNKNKFTASVEDVINPYKATLHYLKKNNFQKKIYALATSSYKKELVREGFKVADDPPADFEENIVGIIKNLKDDEEVGAVVFDTDLHINFIKLQKALTFLKREDCLFITGAADKKLPIGPFGPLLGNYYHYQGLIELSGRKPVQLAKPSEHFAKFIKEQFKIENPKKVLFMGDTIIEDIHFGNKSGFQTLLVLSGSAKIEDIKEWKYPEEAKPNYYLENITELNKIIKNVYNLQ